MVLNWLYNFKYSKKHVKSAITIQKYVRGFLARKERERKLDILEQKNRIFMKWHSIAQQTRLIEAECENSIVDLETVFDNVKQHHYIQRVYQKKRSTMVQQIANLDRTFKHLCDDGDRLPKKMFPHSNLYIQGKKIIPAY